MAPGGGKLWMGCTHDNQCFMVMLRGMLHANDAMTVA